LAIGDQIWQKVRQFKLEIQSFNRWCKLNNDFFGCWQLSVWRKKYGEIDQGSLFLMFNDAYQSLMLGESLHQFKLFGIWLIRP